MTFFDMVNLPIFAGVLFRQSRMIHGDCPVSNRIIPACLGNITFT